MPTLLFDQDHQAQQTTPQRQLHLSLPRLRVPVQPAAAPVPAAALRHGASLPRRKSLTGGNTPDGHRIHAIALPPSRRPATHGRSVLRRCPPWPSPAMSSASTCGTSRKRSSWPSPPIAASPSRPATASARASAPPSRCSGSSTPIRTPSSSSLVNYRYTLVLRPKPSEWPPKSVRSNPPRDPETRRQDRNRLAQQRRQKAKDQGLCTNCKREPSTQGRALCDLCLDRIRVCRQQAKDRGLCINCGAKPAEPGKTCCGPCNEARRILNRKNNAKKKAQS